MSKHSSLIRQNAWGGALLAACLATFACATAETPEYAPPVSGGTGGGGTGGSSSGSSGTGTAGANVAGTTTMGGSSGSGAGTSTGGSNAGTSGASASGGSSGGAGQGGSAGSATGGATGKGGSAGGAGTGGSSSGSGGGGGNAGAASGGGAGGPPSGSIFFDDFEDGDTQDWVNVDDEGVPISGWSLVQDGSTVFKQGSTSSDPSWAIGGNVNWTDQVLEVKLKFDGVPDESAAALISARFKNFDAYYYLELRADGGIKIRKRVDGSTSDVTRYDPDVPLTGDTWYTLGLGAVGATLTAYFNGVAVATATDSSIPAGGIGIGTTEEAVVAFDDVSVTAP
jgi:hypothetical protein